MIPFREVTVSVAGTNSYVPSPVGTKCTRDPDLSPSLFLTSAGIVTWPLLVTVDVGTEPTSLHHCKARVPSPA